MNTWPHYSPECIKEVTALLKQGGSLSAYRANPKFGLGPKEGSHAERLEREIERKFRVKHAVVCNSGTAALHMALLALDLRGAEVVTSPYTFSATAAAIILAGGRPVFADVDPHSYSITKETVKRVLTRKTKAILPVHLFGHHCDTESLASFGLPIVEDACQAVGATRNGLYSGTHGIAGAYSFNGTKNLPCGEGGALVTNDDRIAERARLLGNHSESFYRESIGLNYRMQEVVACIARHGLRDLDERNRHRDRLVHIVFPWYKDRWPNHVWYVTPFIVGVDRKRFARACKKRGLEIGQGYISPTLEKIPAFRKYARGPLPVVTELSERSLCLLSNLTPAATAKHALWTKDVITEASLEVL